MPPKLPVAVELIGALLLSFALWAGVLLLAAWLFRA